MESDKTINILILCADNKTAAYTQTKLQKNIDYLIKKYFTSTSLSNQYPKQQLYYMGINLTDNPLNNKCNAMVDAMVEKCKYTQNMFDIILSEACPLRFMMSIFSNKFFQNIKYLLSDNGIISWMEPPPYPNIGFDYSIIDNNNKLTNYKVKAFYNMIYTKYSLKYITSYSLEISEGVTFNYCIIKKERQVELHKTYNPLQTVSNKNVTSTPVKNINPMNKSKIAHTKGIGLSYQTLLNSIYFIKY